MRQVVNVVELKPSECGFGLYERSTKAMGTGIAEYEQQIHGRD
jgi:hypothetical protein